jgi:hypothetical protein
MDRKANRCVSIAARKTPPRWSADSIVMLVVKEMPDIVGSLSGKNVMPLCAKHEPKASLQKEGGGYIVFVHCDECRFTAWIHPDAYYDMMVDFMLEEVEESIREGNA